LEDAAHDVPPDIVEEHLGQLLGDGAGPAAFAEEDRRACRSAHIDAAVVPETFILGGQQGLHHVWVDVRIVHRDAVLPVVLPHDGAIAEEHRRGQVAPGIL
jgi:hypothetical protein